MKNQSGPTSIAEVMTVHELAIYLKTSAAKIHHMARTRDVPTFQIGKPWRYKRKMIDTWIHQKMEPACDPPPNLQIQLPEKL